MTGKLWHSPGLGYRKLYAWWDLWHRTTDTERSCSRDGRVRLDRERNQQLWTGTKSVRTEAGKDPPSQVGYWRCAGTTLLLFSIKGFPGGTEHANLWLNHEERCRPLPVCRMGVTPMRAVWSRWCYICSWPVWFWYTRAAKNAMDLAAIIQKTQVQNPGPSLMSWRLSTKSQNLSEPEFLSV